MASPVLAEALVRWQHAAGPYWPYVCAAPFLGLGESDLLARRVLERGALSRFRPKRVSPGHAALADQLLAASARPDADNLSVLLVDLPAERVLACAPLLVAAGWYVVPVIQRWIASPAVVSCRRLFERLLVGAWQARRPSKPRGAILIADGERGGPSGYPLVVPGRAFDNRYEYQTCRFPSTSFLAAQDVERVGWISGDQAAFVAGKRPAGTVMGIPPVASDLHPYREGLVRAGIGVDVLPWPPG